MAGALEQVWCGNFAGWAIRARGQRGACQSAQGGKGEGRGRRGGVGAGAGPRERRNPSSVFAVNTNPSSVCEISPRFVLTAASDVGDNHYIAVTDGVAATDSNSKRKQTAMKTKTYPVDANMRRITMNLAQPCKSYRIVFDGDGTKSVVAYSIDMGRLPADLLREGNRAFRNGYLRSDLFVLMPGECLEVNEIYLSEVEIGQQFQFVGNQDDSVYVRIGQMFTEEGYETPVVPYSPNDNSALLATAAANSIVAVQGNNN